MFLRLISPKNYIRLERRFPTWFMIPFQDQVGSSGSTALLERGSSSLAYDAKFTIGGTHPLNPIIAHLPRIYSLPLMNIVIRHLIKYYIDGILTISPLMLLFHHS